MSTFGGSRNSVYSHASTVRTIRAGGPGASSKGGRSRGGKIPWYKKPILSHAIYTDLQRGSWHIGFYSLVSFSWYYGGLHKKENNFIIKEHSKIYQMWRQSHSESEYFVRIDILYFNRFVDNISVSGSLHNVHEWLWSVLSSRGGTGLKSHGILHHHLRLCLRRESTR